MKTFIKDNWFKIVIALVVVLIGISTFYYFVILSSQKETRIQEKVQADLIEKSRKETLEAEQKSEKEQAIIDEANRRQSSLNDCIALAKDRYLKMGIVINNINCDALYTDAERVGCGRAKGNAYDDNEARLQQDKENCFRQYPQ